jgi:twitching motility two-component system response regulator PilH
MSQTILVVDDSPTDRMAITDMVRSFGYHTIEADSAEEAFEATQAHRPDLVLMDVVMPGSSGYEATRKMSRDSDFSNIPVIIVSNRNKETDKLWGLRQGAKAYIFKPIDADTLRKEIQRALE